MTVLPMKTLFQNVRAIFHEARQIYREKGFRAVVKRYGWKLVIGVFCYYLIRDILIYLVLPSLLWRAVV